MKKITKNIAALIALGIGSTTIGTAQITHQKIGDNPTTINSSAVLEVESTDKGALLPRIALTDLKDATTIANAANALTVFNTATAGTAPNDVTPGYYYWKKDEIIPANSTWVRLTDGATPTPYWSLVGNAGTDPANNFLGTTDNQDLIFKVNNSIRLIGPKSSNMYLLSGAPSMLNSYLSNPLTGKYFGGFTTFNGEHSIYNFSETGQSYGWNSGAASGTPAAPGIPDTGALMSTVNGMLYDGTNFIKVARMRMHADGTPTATSLPTKITFWTTPANSKADVERLVIKNNGNVGIGLTYPGNPSNTLHVRNAAGNPVRFEGLQTGVATDKVVVADNTGVLKTVPSSNLAIEPWNIEGTANKATANTDDIYQMGNVAIGTSTLVPGTALDVRGAVRVGIPHQDELDGTSTVGSNSMAVGFNNLASEEASIALGRNNKATGLFGAIAMGSGAEASGEATTALGRGKANGQLATAIGNGAEANGGFSIAMGSQSVANGSHSIAMGFESISNGYYSTTIGKWLTAASNDETVIGSNNAIKTGTSAASSPYVSTDALFQIGNSRIYNSPNNAITVLKNAHTAIGVSGIEDAAKPTELLDLGGAATAGNGGLKIRNINSPAYTGNASTDKVVVADNTGVLKTVAPSSLAVEPWNVRGTATTKATDNAQNIYQKGNVAIGTQNGLGTFHIDTAKDNPATGTPTATNVLDDFITSDRGRFGFGYYPSDVFNASGQFDDKVTFQANDDLDLNYSLATTDNGQAIVHRNIISSGTIETRTARPTGTSIAAFEGHTSVQNRGYGLSSLGVTQQRAGMVLRTGKYNDLGGEIWFGVSGASAGDGGKTLVNAAGVKYRAVMDQKGNWAFGSDPNFDNFWRSPSERLDLILGGMRIGALGYGPLAAWRVAEIAERPNYISTDANDRLVVADANGVLKVKEVATILPTEPWRVQTTTNNATANADHIYQTGRVGVGDFSMAFPVGYTPKKLEVKGDFKSETIVGGNLVGMEVNSPLVTQGAGTYWINPTTREAHSMSVGQFGASATVIDDYAAAVPGKVSNFILDLNAVNVYSKHNGEAKQGTLEVNGANGYFALYANEHNKFGAMVKSAGEDGLLLYHANSEASDNVSLKNRTEVVVKKADGVTFHHHDASGTLSGSYTFPKTNGTNGQVMTRSTGNSVVWADAIPKFFYAPSMVMPTSTTGGLPAHVSYAGGVFTVDLHAVYSNQYGMTGNVAGPTRTALKSPSATTLPVVPAVNLEYFVTYFDNTVFNPDTIQLTNAGILTYEILPGAVVTEKTYMNITFKVK